jgi:pimeloyl-[acyl-carrier protein] methyl ester esterase
MKPLLLLIHGWGFDGGFWAPLQRVLECDAMVWDLGFFGRPERPPLPAGRPVVAVGHSFGVLWLMHHRPAAWRVLISINGFSCFTRRETFPEGAAARPLQRMISQCAETPLRVVSDFRIRCGSAAPLPTGLDQARLLDGLQSLHTWDERPAPTQLALCGRNDPVVSTAMSRACFAEDCIVWHDGGHLLPQEDPAWCAVHLRQLAERLT